MHIIARLHDMDTIGGFQDDNDVDTVLVTEIAEYLIETEELGDEIRDNSEDFLTVERIAMFIYGFVLDQRAKGVECS